MTLTEYLYEKYGVKNCTTLTCQECKVLGIPFPLVSGWMHRYNQRIISAETAEQLIVVLKKRLKKGKEDSRGKLYARKGIEVLVNHFHLHVPIAPKPVSKKLKGSFAATDDFLATYEWRRVRMEAIKRYGSRCQCCGASPATGAVINVDHIKPRRIFPHLALSLDNLQVLCHDCNHGKGNWDMTDWRDAPEHELSEEQRAHLRDV